MNCVRLRGCLSEIGLSAALLLVFVQGPIACIAHDGMQEKLGDATRKYMRSLRWGDFAGAATYLPPESMERFMEQHEALREELVILEYDLTHLRLDKKNGVARARYEIAWHTDRRLIVERTTIEETWQWFSGNWILVDERRVRGKPLAIFANHSEPLEMQASRSEKANMDTANDDQYLSSHPYLPGLKAFRKQHGIGLSDQQKRQRERENRRKAKKSQSGESP